MENLPHPSPADPTAMLLAFLRNHDAPCPICGYNLRHLTIPRCPECGRDLKLSVGATEPYMRAWIALLIPTLLMAGIGTLLAMAMAQRGMRIWRYDRPLTTIIMIYWLLNIPIGALAIWKRKSIMRWNRGTQIAIAIADWLLAAAAMAIYFNAH